MLDIWQAFMFVLESLASYPFPWPTGLSPVVTKTPRREYY